MDSVKNMMKKYLDSKNHPFAIASALLISLLIGATVLFWISDHGFNGAQPGQGTTNAFRQSELGEQSDEQNQPVLNPKQDLAELEQRAQQAIATAQAALATLPVSAPNLATAPNSDVTRASTTDAQSSDSQSQVTNQSPSQLSDQPADSPPLASQRQAKIDQLHSKLQQLQTQQAKQQQLRQDKQDSLSRYGLE